MSTRETVTISLPPEMRQWIDNLVEAGGYASVSEYVRELVRVDRDRRTRAWLEAELIAAMESGPATPLDAKAWEKIKADGMRLAERMRSEKKVG